MLFCKNYNGDSMTEIYDIIIIGSGMVGTMSAYFLKDSNKKIMVLDKDLNQENATMKSTGKISYLQKDIYQKLEKYYDYETSKDYFKSQKDSMNLLTNLIKKEKIKCGLEKIDTYLFTNNEQNIEKVKKEKELLESFGAECFSSETLPLDHKIQYAFYVKDNYIFYPSEFLKQLRNIISKNVTLKDKELVTDIKKEEDYYSIIAGDHTFRAKQVIVATHYPFFLIKDLIPLRVYVKQEYITLGRVKDIPNFCAINIEKQTESIRVDHNHFMYIGTSNKCTDKKWYTNHISKNEKKASKMFEIDSIKSYMNQDLITNDYLPIIGYIDDNQKNLLVASGFNAWGITNSVLSAKILSEMLMGREHPYQHLFRVKRISVIGSLNMIMNGLLEAKAYIKNIFYQPNKIYKVKMNGKNYYLYVDENHQRHYIETKCPHLKCNLLFNKEEKTWDCPCHGSRFDLDGNLMESPSKKNIGATEKIDSKSS